MALAASIHSDDEDIGRWSQDAPQVRRALRFIKGHKGGITPEALVAWDDQHGRRLFTWANTQAAEQWRVHEARLFFNRFRWNIGGLRVRSFINMSENKDEGIDERSYVSTETISENKKLRDIVIGDITRRMKSLASELKMWNLTDNEREAIFAQIREQMG